MVVSYPRSLLERYLRETLGSFESLFKAHLLLLLVVFMKQSRKVVFGRLKLEEPCIPYIFALL